MKVIYTRRVPNWYWGFTLCFFCLLVFVPLLLVHTKTDVFPPIYKGNEAKAQVAFACNVFWGEEYLPEMLDIFKKNNIKITFFIGGSWAKQHPELLKKIVEDGHELGNHTYSHPHPNAIGKDMNKEQISKAEDLIKDLTGIKTVLYAPPYGEFNDVVLSAAKELGYTTIMWSIDTIDWKKPSDVVIVSRVMSKIHNGAIILMHPTAPTVKALPTIIRELQAKGFAVGSVSMVIE